MKMNDVSIMRFTYGLACVTWVLIAMGLAWVAANADEYGSGELRAPVVADGAAVQQAERLAARVPREGATQAALPERSGMPLDSHK